MYLFSKFTGLLASHKLLNYNAIFFISTLVEALSEYKTIQKVRDKTYLQEILFKTECKHFSPD